MKKKILIAIFILVLLASAGVIYLNQVVIPVNVKSMITEAIAERTQKKAEIESLRFNIFKGLAFKNLSIYDEKEVIVRVKEGSCFFLLAPFFKRAVVIPVLSLRSPEILLVRRKDNTFNLSDLFFDKKSAPSDGRKSPEFGVYIYKVDITDGRLYFRDETFSGPFTKELSAANVDLYFTVPDRVKFNFTCDIQGNPSANIKSSGSYRIFSREFSSQTFMRNVSVKEYAPYYQASGVTVSEGLVNAQADISSKEGIARGDVTLEAGGLALSREKFFVRLTAHAAAGLQYVFETRKLKFSGKAKVMDSAVSGQGLADALQGINGEIDFDNSGLSSKQMKAFFLGVPTEAQIKITNFAQPFVDVSVSAGLNLVTLQDILKKRFNFDIPADITGQGRIFLDMKTTIPPAMGSRIGGHLDIKDAAARPKKFDFPVSGINGRVEFSHDRLKWADLSFDHQGTAYKSSGTLVNFNSPQVSAALSSDKLSVNVNFKVTKPAVQISKLAGRYLNSEFAIDGNVDISGLPRAGLELEGGVKFDLRDAKEFLKKFEKQLDKAALSGMVNAQFTLNGDAADFKSWGLRARLNSPLVSAYGLKFRDFLINYNQAGGVINIPILSASLYDGSLKAEAGVNMNSNNILYQVSAAIDGIKIEKLKLDTPIKDKDIAGLMRGDIKLNGFSGDPAKLSGGGRLFITNGRLWQLDLFKGLGALIFAKDFANIVFTQGSCAFIIKDKYAFTDSLRMTSNIADLAGTVKVGFNSSLDATLDVMVNDEMAPLTGTFRDITTAIVGQAGKFGTIKIAGTLSEPKYTFQAAVVDFIKGIKNIFLKTK